ncbi:MAG: AAA family ATPase, partial [Phycisphaeraceae bacterium JB051]
DEIEKAHPDVFNMLLQIMEEGQLTDSFGRHVDFRNTVLILTSNIGADLIKTGGGFGFSKPNEETDYSKMKQTLINEIERYFRPEFINRLDDIIVFRALNRANLEQIVDYELRKVYQRLTLKELKLEIDDQARDYLIEKGYNPDYGARPLRRAIEQYVEDALSESILRGKFKAGQLIKATHVAGEEGLKFEGVDVKSDDKPDDESENLAEAGAETN